MPRQEMICLNLWSVPYDRTTSSLSFVHLDIKKNQITGQVGSATKATLLQPKYSPSGHLGNLSPYYAKANGFRHHHLGFSENIMLIYAERAILIKAMKICLLHSEAKEHRHQLLDLCRFKTCP